MGGQRTAIPTCVGDEQQHMFNRAVALLEGDAALNGLQVFENGLCLHRDRPADATDHGVPGSSVVLNRQRHLRPPAEGWIEPHAESFENALLPRIADRVACRIRP